MLAGLGRGGWSVLDRSSGSTLPLVGLVGLLRVVGLRLSHALLVGLRRRCSVCVCAGSEPEGTAAQDACGGDGARDDVDEALRLVGIHDLLLLGFLMLC